MSDPWIGEDEPSLVGAEWKYRAQIAESRLRELESALEQERGWFEEKLKAEAECDRLRKDLDFWLEKVNQLAEKIRALAPRRFEPPEGLASEKPA